MMILCVCVGVGCSEVVVVVVARAMVGVGVGSKIRLGSVCPGSTSGRRGVGRRDDGA
jgi:hypothetical protein